MSKFPQNRLTARRTRCGRDGRTRDRREEKKRAKWRLRNVEASTETKSKAGGARGAEQRGGKETRRRKPRAPGRQNDQKANFIHYFHFNATVSQFMGGPGFMRARIRTTGPNLREPTGQKRSRAESGTSRKLGERQHAHSGPIIKNFVLKRCTSRIVYVNSL